MAVNLAAPDPASLFPVKGVRIGVTEAGVRKANRKDLMLMTLAPGSRVAAVFTRNRFCAAPVILAKTHLQGGEIRALLVNTGCANAGTGEDGLRRAGQTCEAVAKLLECSTSQVLPFSTGVIMEPLPVDRIAAGLPGCIANLGDDNWGTAALSIMK
ncbi:MAG TPA: bifunctional ornithine acetyltransferase/N-acetylglutamate synthase, partial [Burkholderiales bacterium]|nr:bifunctional ornithine acetyltransferase/N-acetylglutamate synthase [Burkholderiales bacterium]